MRILLRNNAVRGALAALLAIVTGACESGEDALGRGDRYWADSNYVAALAEYRLAARDGSSEAERRVAHAYAVTGQLDRARRAYDQLVKADPKTIDQALYDYMWMARTSLQRGDRYGAARAAEAALELRPDLPISELALTLARHYSTIGDADRALQFYRRAVATAAAATRNSLLYEIASLTERNGDCVDALPYFRSFTERSSNADSVTEARWRMGSCGLERGRQLREAGDAGRALELLSIPLDLGAPQNLLDQAWYERGEALMALGRRDEAAIAYERVIDLSIAGRTQLAGRAMRRLEEIRSGTVP
jgi:tetratricopeptide (TPR) repeat protein